jgi:ACR3 family arsenite transporter
MGVAHALQAIAMIAVPLVLQTYGIFFIAWWGAR